MIFNWFDLLPGHFGGEATPKHPIINFIFDLFIFPQQFLVKQVIIMYLIVVDKGYNYFIDSIFVY